LRTGTAGPDDDAEQLQMALERALSDHNEQMRWLGRQFDAICADPGNRSLVYDTASIGQHLALEFIAKTRAAQELAEQCGFAAAEANGEVTP
jgi:hypothetical protein